MIAIAFLISFYMCHTFVNVLRTNGLPSSSCMKLLSIVPPVIEPPKKLFEWFTDRPTTEGDTGTNSVVNNSGRFAGVVVTDVMGNSGIGRGV